MRTMASAWLASTAPVIQMSGLDVSPNQGRSDGGISVYIPPK